MTGNETREHIIQTGAELILRNGFRATGINTVLEEAGVPKGSFYYYFKSKNDFGLAVIDAYAEVYRQRLDQTLGIIHGRPWTASVSTWIRQPGMWPRVSTQRGA